VTTALRLRGTFGPDRSGPTAAHIRNASADCDRMGSAVRAGAAALGRGVGVRRFLGSAVPSESGEPSGWWRPVGIAAAVSVLAAAWFSAGWGGPTVIRYVDDFGCGVAAAVAGAAAWRAGRRSPAPYRASWRILAAGAFAWAASEALWAGVDVTTGSAVSNAALSNAAFLLLPVLASAALLRLPHDGGAWLRSRWLLDGAIVAASTCLIVWDVVVERIHDIDSSGIALLTSAAYVPVDIALLTAVLLAGSHARISRHVGYTLAAALALLTIGDSGYAYLAVTGRYATGAFCDAAYIAAFAALTAAATMPPGQWPARTERRAAPTRLRLTVVPYLPLAAAGAVVTMRLAAGQSFGGPVLILWTTITVLIIVRQYLGSLDNRRLVADLQQRQDQLRSSALSDPLTGIGNRTLFADRVQHALQLHERDERPVTVCWIDLDDFKLVNDTFGHAAGDRLLIDLAARMSQVLRAGDTLARVGGDEFAVLLENGDDPLTVAGRILACAEAPIDVDAQPIHARLSIGISTLAPNDPPADADELMRRADIAMYDAKGQRKQHLTVYRPGMTVPGAEDAALRQPLKNAVAAGSIEVHYQPIVAADTGTLHGFEALARWQLNGTPIPPDKFIPLAERLGLARDLGEHILTTALTQLGDWSRQRGDSTLGVGVNLSPDQLLDPQLPHIVARALLGAGVQPRQLYLEITEGALLTDSPHAVANTQALTRMGVSLSLDDFGTGYSSLAHLRCFPLTVLKIDRSFIADIDTDRRARRFLRALYRLGRDLDLQLIAEGVERPSQLDVVRNLGPCLLQGYLACRPQPAAYFHELLTTHSPALPLTGADVNAEPREATLARASAD
jgi:diguanylate cyclase